MTRVLRREGVEETATFEKLQDPMMDNAETSRNYTRESFRSTDRPEKNRRRHSICFLDMSGCGTKLSCQVMNFKVSICVQHFGEFPSFSFPFLHSYR